MADDPFEIWRNRTISVFFTFGRGDRNLKGNSKPNKFKLVALDDFDGEGATAKPFRLDFGRNQLPNYWHQVLLVPMGDKPPPPPDILLPAIEDLTPGDLVTNLETVNREIDTADTRMMRLQGLIPVPVADPNVLKFDEVRIAYLENAMKDKHDPNKLHDYVVINFRTVMGGGPKPNGGGSGPPD